MPTDWNGWIEIFRAGDFGAKGTYTEGDLDRIVSSYDPNLHEAPLTIGHPEHDRPAFGWVTSLKREGKQLLAKFANVQDEFKSWIEHGLYKTRSVSLYKDFSKGGGLYLRHVGFLGAMPPEVKGLAALPTFAEDESESVDFYFQDRQGGFMGLFKRSTNVASDADLSNFQETIADKIDRMIKEKLKTQLDDFAKELSERLESMIDGSMRSSLWAQKNEIQREVGKLVSERIEEAIANHPRFSESASRRRVHFTEGSTPAVGIELAEDAEALAEKEGISYGEALTRVRAHQDNIALRENPPRTYKVGEVTFTEDPRHPVDMASVERANRAEAVSRERGVSYQDGLGLVRQAEEVARERKLSFSEALQMV